MKTEYLTLGDVCTKGSSNIAQKDLEGNDGEYEIYGASGLIKKVNFFHQDKPYIAVVKDGAGVGRTMLLPAKSSVIGTMQYIIPFENVDIEYLYYAISYMDLSRYYMGAAIPHIYFKDYKNEKLPVPNIDTQKHIAFELRLVDRLYTARQKQLAKLNELIASRFIEMFGEPETNPCNWSIEPLSNRIKVIGGYAFKSELFSDSDGIPVLRIGNINSGVFKPVNLVFYQKDNNLNRYVMYPGDLVMSLTGTVGKDDYGNVCILDNSYYAYYLNQRNAKLELGAGIDKYYLSTLLKFETIKKKLTGISRGVRQANISNMDILNLHVPIPPINLQEQFAAFVAQTDKSKLAVQKSLEQLETLKKSLMQKYFG